VSPERADLVLPSDIPHGEGDVLVLDSLDIEADGRDGGYDFTELELVQDGRLTSSVETNLRVSLNQDIHGIQNGLPITAYHQNAHLLLAKEAGKEPGNRETHD